MPERRRLPIGPTLTWIACAALVLATLLPFVPTNEWWVRIFDFPRVQIAILIAAAIPACWLLLGRRRRGVRLLVAALALCLGYQIHRILPYTPVVSPQAVALRSCPEGQRVSLLVANVLQDNRDSRRLLEMVGAADPDIVLLAETDAWWDRRLSALEPAYPHAVRQPQSNTYGMHLFSKLALVDPRVRFRVEEDIPSIETRIRLRSGVEIAFHGVHPRPPRPAQDTAARDAELVLVGREVAEAGTTAILAGDLNDVAWSDTTRLFQEVSGLLDPRVGRGLFPTYNADWPLLRWPLDHVFFEASFAVLEIRRMNDIGSDHFPMYIALCHQPAVAPAQDRPAPEAEDLEDAEETIEEGREETEGR